MPRCVHCGEPVEEGQEVCFACGQKARAGVSRHQRPLNAAVFVFAGVLVLAVIVGLIIANHGRAKRARTEGNQQEQVRIKDSIRTAALTRRDSANAAAQSDAAGILADEVDKLQQRFDIVRGEVVKGQPSPAQAKLISQTSTEIVRLRQLTVTITSQPGSTGDSLTAQVRDGERRVRTLISDLSRAPTK